MTLFPAGSLELPDPLQRVYFAARERLDALVPVIVPAIIVGAALLSLFWVFLVPIFEAPDEPAHFDYAVSIYGSGHLLNGRVSGVQGVYPYTSYLEQAADVKHIAFNTLAPVPSRYGTAAYYEQLDRRAPHVPGNTHYLPVLLSVYPFGYYAAVALWMGGIHLFTDSLVALFFGARVFSVLLLVCSLALGYGIARELGVSRITAALLTFAIGFFPLTSFVSSYVQPDNLSLTLVNLTLYCALVVRRQPRNWTMLLLLGIGLGLLLVTKYQIYACIFLPVVGMLVTERLLSPSGLTWKRLAACLIPPSLVLGLVQMWVTWKTAASYSAAIGSKAVAGQVNTFAAHQAMSRGIGPFLVFVMSDLNDALHNYLLDGPSFMSFLGYFGWLDTPLTIGSPSTELTVRHAAALLAVVIAIFGVVRLCQAIQQLFERTRRSGWRAGAQQAFRDPVAISLLLFIGVMFFLYVMTSNTFGAQGRNWFPFILPIFLAGVLYAPNALPIPWLRVLFSRFVLLCLLLYSAFGSYYAVKSVTQRYYGSRQPHVPILSRTTTERGTSSVALLDHVGH